MPIVLDNGKVQGSHVGYKTCEVDTWKPMDDALVKEKAHKAKESE